MKKLGGILVLSMVMLGACTPGQLPPGPPNGALGFVVRPGAVQGQPNTVSPTLVPVGDCVFGFGPDSPGTHRAPGTFRGMDGCTRLVLERVWQPESNFTAVAAVPGSGESMIGIGLSFVRLDRSGELLRGFKLEPDRQAVALARAGRNLVGVGYRDYYGEERSEPVAWVSGDEGQTAREITLPQDGPGRWSPTAIAADGEQVLVVGSYGGDVRVWASGDAGVTWTVSKVLVRGSDLWFNTALRTGGKWLLAGGSAAGPLVVTGEPGDWTLEDPASLGDGRLNGGTVDKTGRPVLVGERTEEDWSGSRRSCSVVWVLDSGWQRGELGCPADTVTAAVTLRDGRVLLASNTDLWIRP